MYRCINKYFQGGKGIILVFTDSNHFFKMEIRKELVVRYRPRGGEGNLKVVNTKTLCNVKKCKRLLYYKSLILQNQKAIQLLPIYDDKN